MDWYLLQTKPNAGEVAKNNLSRQGFEVFFPVIKKTSKSGGKFVNKTIPLFPSYLFIGTLLTKISWKSVNSTSGVSKAISFDGKYRSIRGGIVESLKSRCDENDVICGKTDFLTGDRVKIEKGPFADFICTVENIAHNQRVWVLIDMLQQETRAKISMGDISKVF